MTPPPHAHSHTQLVVCTCVFTLVAGGGYALFGSSTQANILNNLTPQHLAPVVGPAAGAALSFLVRLGYCISLMVRGVWGGGGCCRLCPALFLVCEAGLGWRRRCASAPQVPCMPEAPSSSATSSGGARSSPLALSWPLPLVPQSLAP